MPGMECARRLNWFEFCGGATPHSVARHVARLFKRATTSAKSSPQARGVRAAFGDGAVPYMRNQMKGWLDLSQRGLPSSLLLLSRALVSHSFATRQHQRRSLFNLPARRRPRPTHTCTLTLLPQVLTQPATADADEQLVSVRDTLLTLPEEVIQDVGLEVGAGADAGGACEDGKHAFHVAHRHHPSRHNDCEIGRDIRERGAITPHRPITLPIRHSFVATGAAELQKRLELTLKEQAMIKQEAAAAKELEEKQKAAAVSPAVAADGGSGGVVTADEQLKDPAEAAAAATAAQEQAAADDAVARNAAALAAASVRQHLSIVRQLRHLTAWTDVNHTLLAPHSCAPNHFCSTHTTGCAA